MYGPGACLPACCLVCCLLQVYLQCALLYTTTDGARRVRISTLALPVSDQMGAVFKGADLDSQLANMTRQVREGPWAGRGPEAGSGWASAVTVWCISCAGGGEPWARRY